MLKRDRKRFVSAVSILVGTCIGAGVLGIPYVAAKSGFFVGLAHIVLIGLVILMVNLYLGEISLRTRGNHQLAGYAEKYLGKKAKYVMEFATIFGIYSSIIAYMVGVGISLSFLVVGNESLKILFGLFFGLLMSLMLWKGMESLKKFEKIGVGIVLSLLGVIVILFFGKIEFVNLLGIDYSFLLLPFGVVLFALMSFHAIPEVEIVLKKNEHLMKPVILTSTLISVIFYILFTLVVVGFKGNETPEIATLALGSVFVFLGIFTMFTSYLSVGNALRQNFMFDDRFSFEHSWLLSAVVPIFLFLFIEFFDFFSFTSLLSIGGVVSGGLTAILILFMVHVAKEKGNRKPEYEIPFHRILIWLLMLVFIAGVVIELI